MTLHDNRFKFSQSIKTPILRTPKEEIRMVDNRFYKNKGPFLLKELAEIGECEIVNGDGQKSITEVATLEAATGNDLSFFSNHKYLKAFQDSKAAACIVASGDVKNAPKKMILLISDNPYASYARIIKKFYEVLAAPQHIAKTAVIGKNSTIAENCAICDYVVIGDNVSIGKNCYIGSNTTITDGVIIGDNTKIMSNVTISFALIGRNCVFFPGVRIGQEGFGYAPSATGILPVKQLGRVIIGNGVEIGSNTCLDRGAIEDTVVGDNTKIDNLVQIAHNVKIGANCFIVSQAGIGGSTVIGNKVMLGGQVGIIGHVNIGDNVMIAAQSGVITNVAPGEVRGGYPALPIRQWHKVTAMLKKMVNKNNKQE